MEGLHRGASRTKVLVFARAPTPGAVKTRLVPLLGPARAAALHRLMLECALQHARAAAVGPVELWCTPTVDDPVLIEAAARFGAVRAMQCGRDLGARMLNGAQAALQSGYRALIVGTDCPALTVDELQRASHALGEHDAVLIPAEDGGYVLIGFSRCDARVFANVDWGRETVLAATRVNLARIGWSWLELAPSWDVDRPADFARLIASGLMPGLEAALGAEKL